MMTATKMQDLMDRMNLTQVYVAKVTGINTGRISQLVRRKTVPSSRETKALEFFFDRDITELLGELPKEIMEKERALESFVNKIKEKN